MLSVKSVVTFFGCFFWVLAFASRCDVGGAVEVAVDAGDAFDLAFGGETLVESVALEVAGLFFPRTQAFAPALDTAFFRFRVSGG